MGRIPRRAGWLARLRRVAPAARRVGEHHGAHGARPPRGGATRAAGDGRLRVLLPSRWGAAHRRQADEQDRADVDDDGARAGSWLGA